MTWKSIPHKQLNKQCLHNVSDTRNYTGCLFFTLAGREMNGQGGSGKGGTE